MSKGIPLTDEDRKGWLLSMQNTIEEHLFQKHQSTALACSALKKRYRGMEFEGREINVINWLFL